MHRESVPSLELIKSTVLKMNPEAQYVVWRLAYWLTEATASNAILKISRTVFAVDARTGTGEAFYLGLAKIEPELLLRTVYNNVQYYSFSLFVEIS